MKMRLLVSMLAVLVLPVLGRADIIVADLEGSRSSAPGGGIIGDGAWANGGFILTWTITPPDGDTPYYHYKYEFKNNSGALLENLSHWILELSRIIETRADFYNVFFNFSYSPDYAGDLVGPQFWGLGAGNPGFPAGESFWGIKFNEFTDGPDPDAEKVVNVIEFDAWVGPVWGDFYAKDGSPAPYAYNTGLGSDPTSSTTDFTAWIATPDTHIIPAPAALLLGAAGLGLVALARRVRR